VLGGVAASLVIGLAACGNAVAGSGAAGPGAVAPDRSAGAAHATPRPSAGAVNPGGVRIPAGAAALCRAIPGLTRMTLTLSTRPANVNAREAQPRGFTISDAATVRHMATLLCALPGVPAGRMMCPNMTGAGDRLLFFAGDRAFPQIVVETSGCHVVTGLGPDRSWSASTMLGQALARRFGIHLPVPAY
jgi:hypothetical protein